MSPNTRYPVRDARARAAMLGPMRLAEDGIEGGDPAAVRFCMSGLTP